jgi:hypothetical protein
MRLPTLVCGIVILSMSLSAYADESSDSQTDLNGTTDSVGGLEEVVVGVPLEVVPSSGRPQPLREWRFADILSVEEAAAVADCTDIECLQQGLPADIKMEMDEAFQVGPPRVADEPESSP